MLLNKMLWREWCDMPHFFSAPTPFNSCYSCPIFYEYSIIWLSLHIADVIEWKDTCGLRSILYPFMYTRAWRTHSPIHTQKKRKNSFQFIECQAQENSLPFTTYITHSVLYSHSLLIFRKGKRAGILPMFILCLAWESTTILMTSLPLIPGYLKSINAMLFFYFIFLVMCIIYIIFSITVEPVVKIVFLSLLFIYLLRLFPHRVAFLCLFHHYHF